MAAGAEMIVQLVDKASGPAGKIARSVDGMTSAFNKVEGSAVHVSKTQRAIEGLTLAVRALQVVALTLDIVKALGGMEKVKDGFKSAGRGVANFMRSLKPMAKNLAPIAVAGGAGFGAFKLFTGGVAAAGAVSAAIGGITIAASAAALAVGALGTALLVSLGKRAFDAAAWAQSMEMSLGTVSRDMAAGADQFSRVRALAGRLGLNLRTTVEEFQRLRNVGFLPADAERITKLTADLRSLGVRGESVGSILNAMGKIMAQGKLQGDELMMLAEAGVNVGSVYDHLGKTLGKTRDEITKMQTAGKLEAAPALAAIEAAIMEAAGESRAGEAAERVADKTLRGFIGKAQAGLENWFIDLGKRLTPMFDAIGGRLSETFTKLSESGKLDELTDKIFEVFHFAGSWVLQNWPTIEQVVVGAIDAVMVGIDAMMDAVRFAQDHWESIRTVMIGAAIVLGVLAAGGALLVAPFIAAGAAIAAATAALLAFVGWAGAKALELFAAARSWGSGIIDGIVGGIQAGIGRAREAVIGLASGIKNTFMAALGIASPSKVFEQMASFSVEGYAGGLEHSQPRVETAATRMSAAAATGASAPAPASTTTNMGGVTFNLSIQQQPGENAEKLGRDIVTIVRRELLGVLDGAAIASGA